MLKALIGLLAIVLAAPALAAERVALVIGNTSYANAAVLPNAVNDSALITRVLRGYGFVVTPADNLSRAAFVQTLRRFRQQADTAQVAMIYYAGHGLELGGQNWLIPTDAALQDERDLSSEAVQLDEVLQAIAGAQRLRVVVLDACRNNPFPRMRRLDVRRSVGRGLAAPNIADTLVVYSAKAGETARDGASRNSPFARAVANHIGAQTDVQLMFRRVRDEVLRVTGEQQEPYQYGSLRGDALVLAGNFTSPPQSTFWAELAAHAVGKWRRTSSAGLVSCGSRLEIQSLSSEAITFSIEQFGVKHAMATRRVIGRNGNSLVYDFDGMSRASMSYERGMMVHHLPLGQKCFYLRETAG